MNEIWYIWKHAITYIMKKYYETFLLIYHIINKKGLIMARAWLKRDSLKYIEFNI